MHVSNTVSQALSSWPTPRPLWGTQWTNRWGLRANSSSFKAQSFGRRDLWADSRDDSNTDLADVWTLPMPSGITFGLTTKKYVQQTSTNGTRRVLHVCNHEELALLKCWCSECKPSRPRLLMQGLDPCLWNRSFQCDQDETLSEGAWTVGLLALYYSTPFGSQPFGKTRASMHFRLFAVQRWPIAILKPVILRYLGMPSRLIATFLFVFPTLLLNFPLHLHQWHNSNFKSSLTNYETHLFYSKVASVISQIEPPQGNVFWDRNQSMRFPGTRPGKEFCVTENGAAFNG